MDLYKAKDGSWLPVGVTLAEHKAAMAANYRPWEEDWYRPDPDYDPEDYLSYNDERRVWRTREDKVIKYEDLADSHLFNIIRMLHRGPTPDLGSLLPNLWAHARSRHLDPDTLTYIED